MSVLTLALMVLLVVTMRRPGGIKVPKRPPGMKGDRIFAGPGVKLGPPIEDPKRPGVVSYKLMQEGKLPSQPRRAIRRLSRPFDRFLSYLSPGAKKRLGLDQDKAPRRGYGESVELQNFLEARNREIERRKGESGDKPGPDDKLH